MIVDALLHLLANVIHFAAQALPSWTMHLPSGVTDFVRTMLNFEPFFPVQETFEIIAALVTLTLGFIAFKWTIKCVDWVADVLP